MTYICVDNLTITGSGNGLSPYRRQVIIWTNAGILFIGPLRTKFSEILIYIKTFSLKKMHLKMSSAKWRPFCLGLNELTHAWIFARKTEWTVHAILWFWWCFSRIISRPPHYLKPLHNFLAQSKICDENLIACNDKTLKYKHRMGRFFIIKC